MARDEVSDETLMLQYRDGNTPAFDALYGRHKGPLFRYLLRQCRQRSTAEEMFQDVWMRVIGARDRYEVRAKFATWLYRIARNRLVDHYRSANPGRLRSLDDDDDGDPVELTANPGLEPQRRVESERRSAALYRVLGELPGEQRDAFLLHEEAGLTLEEIADVTGVGRETAKSRLRYAVSKLRDALEDSS
jgi:RNA polymerase sigma-70 factor (ECF subfamily)